MKMMNTLLIALTTLAASIDAANVTSPYTPTYKSIYDANRSIGTWINPNALVGILFMLIFFWVCTCVLQLLGNVQTPKIMLEKCIDWGKVEKSED